MKRFNNTCSLKWIRSRYISIEGNKNEQDPNQYLLIINQKNQFQSLFGLVSRVARSAMKQKTARQTGQAVRFRAVGGTGLEPATSSV